MKFHPTLITLLLAFCMLPVARAQERIQVYVREFPTSMADLGIQGPVKMVKIADSATYNGVFEEQVCDTYYFDTKGRLTKLVFNHYKVNVWEEYHYTYDSLGRFLSCASADGKFLQEAVYDSLGRFIYSVYTRGDG